MIPESPIDQARLIMKYGKLMRDRTLRMQSTLAPDDAGKVRFSDLSMAQSIAVMTVREQQPLSITKLSKLLGVSAPSASSMVDRLVERGILTREQNPKDRRKVRVQISPEVVSELDRIENFILQDFITLVKKLGPETASKWCEVLIEVKKIIESKPETAAGLSGQ